MTRSVRINAPDRGKAAAESETPTDPRFEGSSSTMVTHCINNDSSEEGGVVADLINGEGSAMKPPFRRESQSSSPASSVYSDAREEVMSADSRFDPNADDNVRESLRSASTIELPGWRRKIHQVRQTCGNMVNDNRVQAFIITLIVINALLMGIATFDFVTDNPELERTFELIDRVFLIIFSVEVAMQFIYRGFKMFQDGWLVFDFFIVLFSWAFESLQIIRAFRIFRVFRLVTRIKPLRDLVLAIGAVLPRMYAIAALLILVFYIFAVLFTELFSDLDLSSNYFRTLDASLFTCFELMTLEWAGIVREVLEFYNWAWLPFLTFIMITGFIVFNLIVAVVCDAVAVVERQSKEHEEEEPDSSDVKLSQAQGRIDQLSGRVSSMLDTQKQMQHLLDALSGDLYQLERIPAGVDKQPNASR